MKYSAQNMYSSRFCTVVNEYSKAYVKVQYLLCCSVDDILVQMEGPTAQMEI